MIRIPARIRFPNGPTITIKQVSDADMATHGRLDGFYDHNTRTIWLREKLGKLEKAKTLAHEIGHAWLEYFEDLSRCQSVGEVEQYMSAPKETI